MMWKLWVLVAQAARSNPGASESLAAFSLSHV